MTNHTDPTAATTTPPTAERWIAIVACAAVLILVGTWLALMYGLTNWSDRGDFGSMFGAANALFSGLALAGVVYTLMLQRVELSLQRAELRLTRKELQRAADAQELTQRTLSQQVDQMRRSARVQVLAALIQSKAADIQARGSRENIMLRRVETKSLSRLDEQLTKLLEEEIGPLGGAEDGSA